MKIKDYKIVFDRIEKTLKEQSTLSSSEFKNIYTWADNIGNQKHNDKYFRLILQVIFYSGMRSSTVERKLPVIYKHFPDYKTVSKYGSNDIKRIMSDKDMIKNSAKIDACIHNARVFSSLIKEYGSFQEFLDSYDAKESFENLLLLKEDLQSMFSFLGGITSYHFLTDTGFPVLKPDRVIVRIFNRLGLLENNNQLLKAVIHGRKFAQATKKPIRYIDIILVKYGQQGLSKEYGLDDGICLEKNPKCHLCEISSYCNYIVKEK
ncbi:DNA-3-methyladenine glycosylase I [Bacteroidota bacterium]